MVTLVVEDGTGLPTANTYLSVAEADAILELNIHSGWSVLDDDVKERLLAWATRTLEERVIWFGTKVHETAWLSWPRGGLYIECVAVPEDEVPQAVKVAVAMLADALATQDFTAANDSANLKKLDVDVVSLTFDLAYTTSRWPPEIRWVLRNYGRTNFGRGPKYIIKH